MKKISHDRKKCIRCGICASVCPEMFEISKKDGRATLKNSKEMKCAEEAADVCPVGIIKIE